MACTDCAASAPIFFYVFPWPDRLSSVHDLLHTSLVFGGAVLCVFVRYWMVDPHDLGKRRGAYNLFNFAFSDLSVGEVAQVVGWHANQSRLQGRELLRFGRHPDLTNQEIHNAQTWPQNDLQI